MGTRHARSLARSMKGRMGAPEGKAVIAWIHSPFVCTQLGKKGEGGRDGARGEEVRKVGTRPMKASCKYCVNKRANAWVDRPYSISPGKKPGIY